MSTIDDLTEQEARLIAADFAEHVLWIFEEDYPDDHRPRQAIEAAREFARGEIKEKHLYAARDVAWYGALEVGRDGPVSWIAGPRDAAWSATLAAWGSVSATMDAAEDAAASGPAGYACGAEERGNERAWQRQRIDEVVAARGQA